MLAVPQVRHTVSDVVGACTCNLLCQHTYTVHAMLRRGWECMPLLCSQSASPDMPEGNLVVLTSMGPFSPRVFLFQPSEHRQDRFSTMHGQMEVPGLGCVANVCTTARYHRLTVKIEVHISSCCQTGTDEQFGRLPGQVFVDLLVVRVPGVVSHDRAKREPIIQAVSQPNCNKKQPHPLSGRVLHRYFTHSEGSARSGQVGFSEHDAHTA